MGGWFDTSLTLARRWLNLEQENRGLALAAQPCLAIDLELTGLDPRRDHIVSMGWVPIVGREILLADARYLLVRPPISVGQSAIYHGVHDRDLAEASTMEEALLALQQAAEGAVLVAHHSAIERAFLDRACHQVLGKRAPWRFIDTLRLELHQIRQRGGEPNDDGLTLARCLARHRLPPCPQHHALEDAYGCALLLLAQTRPDTPLAHLLSLSR